MAKTIQSAKKVVDGALSTVPKIIQNKDYRQLLVWVEAGNTIAEAD